MPDFKWLRKQNDKNTIGNVAQYDSFAGPRGPVGEPGIPGIPVSNYSN